MVVVDERAFNPGDLLAALGKGRADSGALVSFTGLCRGSVEGEEVAALTLDAHPTFTRAEIERMEEEARRRWPLHEVTIRHRVGRIPPGEAIVFVGVAATHRRAAFDAADYLMDQLKTRAPLWKNEDRDSGSVWLEPDPAELERAARWDAPRSRS